MRLMVMLVRMYIYIVSLDDLFCRKSLVGKCCRGGVYMRAMMIMASRMVALIAIVRRI